jgi:hypothetical protein
MEIMNRFKLGKIYQTGLLLEILQLTFLRNELFYYLYNLSNLSRKFLSNNKNYIHSKTGFKAIELEIDTFDFIRNLDYLIR